MLSPETNATTNATAEETNATAEAQMPGGRVKGWLPQRGDFLLGAAASTAGGVGTVVALAAATAMIMPDELPAEGGGHHIAPETLEHVQENAVTIYSVIVDENGDIIRELGHGSGFFIGGTEGRHIGTAAHVVDPPEPGALPDGETVQYFVRIDGGHMEGTVIPFNPPGGAAVDEVNDIAIVDLGQTTGYTGIEIAPPGSIELGEQLWAVGTPVDPSLAGTVTQVAVGSLEGQRWDSTDSTSDVIQVDGVTHGGHSGCVIVDSNGNAVGILTHGWSGGGGPGSELIISYATRSEELAELLEQYRNSPEFVRLLEGVISGHIDPEVLAGWIDAREALDALQPLWPWQPPDIDLPEAIWSSVTPAREVLIIGDQNSGFGPWSPDSPPDDGGVIDSLVEALDALA